MTDVAAEPDPFAGIEGAILGFDARGRLQSVAWINPEIGMTEAVCRAGCKQGGLAVDRFTVEEAYAYMRANQWGCSNDD